MFETRRPVPADITDPSFGRATSEFIGQDSGDVSALLTVGYNFDGTQSPLVQRRGDAAATTPTSPCPTSTVPTGMTRCCRT